MTHEGADRDHQWPSLTKRNTAPLCGNGSRAGSRFLLTMEVLYQLS